MRRLLGVLVSVTCAVGCESGLSTVLAGTRTGSLGVRFFDQLESYQIELIIDVNGNSAQVSHVCPDNTGSLTTAGSGYSASWSGAMACPPVLFGNCSSVVMTYRSASVQFNPPSEPQDTSTLWFLATGIAAGCDLSGDITASFFAYR